MSRIGVSAESAAQVRVGYCCCCCCGCVCLILWLSPIAAIFSMMMIAMASCIDSCLCVRQKRAATSRGSSPSNTDRSCRPLSAVSTLKLISGSRAATEGVEGEAEGEGRGAAAAAAGAAEEAGPAVAAAGAASLLFSLSDRSLLGCFAAIAAYEMR